MPTFPRQHLWLYWKEHKSIFLCLDLIPLQTFCASTLGLHFLTPTWQLLAHISSSTQRLASIAIAYIPKLTTTRVPLNVPVLLVRVLERRAQLLLRNYFEVLYLVEPSRPCLVLI